MRTWGNRRDGIGLVWKSVSRNKRCVTLDLRQAEGQELFHELLDVSDVLIVGNRPSALERWGIDYETVHAAPPAGRDAPHHRLRPRRPQERPAGLRHPRRGDERLRPRHRPARRPADAAAVHAGRRRRVAGRHLRGDDGALPPRRARRRRPARRRQPHRAPGPADGVVDARLRPARRHPRPGRQPPRRQRAAQRLPHRRRPLAGHLQRLAHHRHAGLPGHRPTRAGRGPRLRRPGPPPGAGGRGRRARRRLGRRPHPRRGDGPSSSPPRSPPRPSTTPSSCWPTSTCRPAAPSSRSTTPTSAP